MGTRKRVRRWAAVVVGVTAVAAPHIGAQDPPPEIERYYGTVRVNPPAPAPEPPKAAEPAPPKPAEPPALIPVSARMVVVTSPADGSSAVAPLTGVANALRDSGEAVAASARSSLRTVFSRMVPPDEPRPLPWAKKTSTTLPEPPVAAAPPAPTIVVVREPVAAPAAAPVIDYRPEPAPAGFAWTPELAAVLGASAAGLVTSLLLVARGVRGPQPQPVVVYATAPGAAEPPAAQPAAMTPPVTPGRLTLLGGLVAGSMPESAEAFDLGPTYEEHLRMQKEAEERSRDAMALHVLEANLALLDEANATEPAVA